MATGGIKLISAGTVWEKSRVVSSVAMTTGAIGAHAFFVYA